MALVLLLSACVGCMSGKGDGWKFTKSWDPREAIGLKQSDEVTPPQVPTRLVSTWEDATLNQPGQKSQRGFGGRILFFNGESEDPVRVEGQLVVYAYDEARAAHETHPTRRYVFPAPQFVRHESECQLGASYSVWLPWDEVGGPQKNVSLIARFEPIGGPLIVGDQTRHLLPGIRQLASGEQAAPSKPVSEIQLTEFSQASQLQLPPQRPQPDRLQPTSIALSSKTWSKRLTRRSGDAKLATSQESAATPIESAHESSHQSSQQ